MSFLAFCVGQYDSDAVFQADLAIAQSISPGGFARLDAVWGYIEKSAGVFDWSDLDRRVGEVLAHGLKVHLMVPYWPPAFRRAGAPDKTQLRDATSLAAFQAFVRALVARYPNVDRVELGNEPNIQNPFAPDGVTPSLQAHVADAVVPLFPVTWHLCTPGLAPASDNVDATGLIHSLSPATFLDLYWNALAPATRKRIRHVGMHPYGRVADIGQSWSPLGQLPQLHTIADRPLIATEYNSAWSDTDAQKATNVPAGLDYMRGLGYVDRVFLYAVSDKATDSSARLGMVNADRTPRPLLGAVEAWAA